MHGMLPARHLYTLVASCLSSFSTEVTGVASVPDVPLSNLCLQTDYRGR